MAVVATRAQHIRYKLDFPEGVNFVIGKSKEKEDRNYIHRACLIDDPTPIAWRIVFDMYDVQEGEAVFSIGVASSRDAVRHPGQ